MTTSFLAQPLIELIFAMYKENMTAQKGVDLLRFFLYFYEP